jgi:hypothetical protein
MTSYDNALQHASTHHPPQLPVPCPLLEVLATAPLPAPPPTSPGEAGLLGAALPGSSMAAAPRRLGLGLSMVSRDASGREGEKPGGCWRTGFHGREGTHVRSAMQQGQRLLMQAVAVAGRLIAPSCQLLVHGSWLGHVVAGVSLKLLTSVGRWRVRAHNTRGFTHRHLLRLQCRFGCSSHASQANCHLLELGPAPPHHNAGF